jgi:hypothetical protein
MPIYKLNDCIEAVFSLRKTPVSSVLRLAIREATYAIMLDRHGLSYEGWYWKQKTKAEVLSWTIPKSPAALFHLENESTCEGLEIGHEPSVQSLAYRIRDCETLEEVAAVIDSCGFEIQTRKENRGAKHQ